MKHAGDDEEVFDWPAPRVVARYRCLSFAMYRALFGLLRAVDRQLGGREPSVAPLIDAAARCHGLLKKQRETTRRARATRRATETGPTR